MQHPMHLGRLANGDDFTLPLDALMRHFLVLGSSGSGKTVLAKAVVEEVIRYCVPCIAIDLQGDIAALALRASGKAPRGAPLPSGVTREKFAARADVKIWSPGTSEIGIPLSFAPDMAIPEGISDEERIRAMGSIADALGSMLDDTKEATLRGFEAILEYAHERDLCCENLEDLQNFLRDPPADLARDLEDLLPKRTRTNMLKSLKSKLVGRGRIMYGQGMPIDVSEMFGQLRPGPAFEHPQRARLSIVYLAHLSLQEQTQFLALLFSAMYRWALTQPQGASHALFYMDEIAPFCPPVRKPPTKEGMSRLLRQARKYGLGMVLATQSPGDLDYTALDQISTTAVGRIKSHQAAHKVRAFLSNVSDAEAERITASLAGKKPGQFTVVSPDNFASPAEIQARWLVTEHRSLPPEEIAGLVSQDDREKFG